MRHILILGTILLLPSAVLAMADGDGAGAGGEDDRGFRRAVGEHYRVGNDAVTDARKRGIPDDELPVVFHIARSARVRPEAVIEMRRKGGKSWMEVSAHFGLTAESFHTPTEKDHGPPYGRAYGYYKNKKRSQWASIRLDDSAIVHLTNLKFLSKHYDLTPDEVIQQHRPGAGFARFHASVKSHHAKKKAAGPHAGDEGAGRKADPRHGSDRGAKGRGRGGEKGGDDGAKGRGKDRKGGDDGSKGRGKGKKGAGV